MGSIVIHFIVSSIEFCVLFKIHYALFWFVFFFKLIKTNDNRANNANNDANVVQQIEINADGVVQVAAQQNPFQFNIGVAHQALLQNNTPFVNIPYTKPSYFKLRVCYFFYPFIHNTCISTPFLSFDFQIHLLFTDIRSGCDDLF